MSLDWNFSALDDTWVYMWNDGMNSSMAENQVYRRVSGKCADQMFANQTNYLPKCWSSFVKNQRELFLWKISTCKLDYTPKRNSISQIHRSKDESAGTGHRPCWIELRVLFDLAKTFRYRDIYLRFQKTIQSLFWSCKKYEWPQPVGGKATVEVSTKLRHCHVISRRNFLGSQGLNRAWAIKIWCFGAPSSSMINPTDIQTVVYPIIFHDSDSHMVCVGCWANESACCITGWCSRLSSDPYSPYCTSYTNHIL